jgi:hypothetical protein
VLKRFSVSSSAMVTDILPTFKSTGKGLLVSSYETHFLPLDEPNPEGREVHVEIEYQTVDGFPIPAKLSMELLGTAGFYFTLDGCTVSREPK